MEGKKKVETEGIRRQRKEHQKTKKMAKKLMLNKIKTKKSNKKQRGVVRALFSITSSLAEGELQHWSYGSNRQIDILITTQYTKNFIFVAWSDVSAHIWKSSDRFKFVGLNSKYPSSEACNPSPGIFFAWESLQNNLMSGFNWKNPDTLGRKASNWVTGCSRQ